MLGLEATRSITATLLSTLFGGEPLPVNTSLDQYAFSWLDDFLSAFELNCPVALLASI